MLKNKFDVNKNSEILLYGAASIGKLMYQSFYDRNYKIVGFIDKRADEIQEFCGLPVWSITQVPIQVMDKDNVIVFVAVKNVFEHNSIVKELVQEGFCRILYKPYNALIGNMNSDEIKIDEAYENFSYTEGYWENISGIPETSCVMNVYTKDFGIAQQADAYVTAFIPVDYIYTNDYKEGPMEKWGNINLLAFFTHLEFFNYLQGDINADFTIYVEEYCVFTAINQGDIKITQAWKDNIIRNRTQIYEQMNLSLQLDNRFFIQNAPKASWNEKGWFNLNSGKHRATFLVSKGHYLIPLHVKKSEYENFINLEKFNELVTFCNQKGEDMEKLNIPHPYLYRTVGINKSLYYAFVGSVTKILAERLYRKYGKIDFSKLKIWECMGDFGQIGMFFSRMGSCMDWGIEDSEISDRIKNLEHLADEISHKDGINCNEAFNCAFIDLDYILDKKINIEDIKCNIFVVVGRDAKQIKNFGHRVGCSSVKRISNTVEEKGLKFIYWCEKI